MPFIDASHIPATGNQEIDRDHLDLAVAMNRIYEKWQEGLRCPMLAEELEALRSLLSSHFAKETTIARGAGYQRWLDHHQEHAEFAKKFDAFLQECREDATGKGAKIDVFMELERHLFEHEVMTDQELWGLWAGEHKSAPEGLLIGWRPEYSVGVEHIDHQHQRLIAMMNEAHSVLNAGKALSHVVYEKLKNIYLEAVQHFQAEEKYFSQLPNDLAERHRSSHEGLIRDLKRAVDDSEMADAERLLALLEGYLKYWLLDHIVYTDSRLKEYLR